MIYGTEAAQMLFTGLARACLICQHCPRMRPTLLGIGYLTRNQSAPELSASTDFRGA